MSSPDTATHSSWATGLRSFLARLEIDEAVVFALLTRGWQAMAGLVSVLLIARFFSPETQGFYYTFASLLALQSFVELGFYLVIVNIVSHEWAKLGLDNTGRIAGDPSALSRLASVGRFIFKWYAVASVVFIVGVGLAGYVFFSQSLHPGVQWQAPWLSVVVLTGLILWTLPFHSLLEGCNQVASVNRFRLVQAGLASVALWLTVGLGGGLWATVASAGVTLSSALYFLLVRYHRFFEPFVKLSTGSRVHWRTEIWPMQWRLALQGLVSYFMFSLFNPVMFHYHGAIVAGRMGMTWQLVNMLQALALVWVQTKVPRFGMLIARRDYASLDRLWWRTSLVSFLFISGGAGVVWFLVYLLDVTQLPLAERLLKPLPTGLFLLGLILSQITQCLAAYLRAHKKEPLVVVGTVSGVTVGFLVWILGRRYGPTGAAAAYLGVLSLVSLPLVTLIWYRCRANWHRG